MISIRLRRLHRCLPYWKVLFRCFRPGIHARIPLVIPRFPESISILSAVPEQPVNFGQVAQQFPCADVIADLSFCVEQIERTLAVTDRVVLGVHPSLAASDQASTPACSRPCRSLVDGPGDTFPSSLEREAFACLHPSWRVSAPCGAARHAMIRAKTHLSLTRASCAAIVESAKALASGLPAGNP